MTSDSVMDERTLREIYLPAFEIAVKEGHAKCLMTSYNMLNGQYTNENKHLLQDILTREWDYDGLIVTDWGGDNDRVRGLIAGNSLEMPGTGGETDRQILDAVQSGAVERELLDERVARLLRLVSDAESAFGSAPDCDLAEHHEFAARFAEGGCFPHESGIFLGYPLEDVCGFIANKGNHAKLCGEWKVYGDAHAAARTFHRYTCCRQDYLDRFAVGTTLDSLIVA